MIYNLEFNLKSATYDRVLALLKVQLLYRNMRKLIEDIEIKKITYLHGGQQFSHCDVKMEF